MPDFLTLPEPLIDAALGWAAETTLVACALALVAYLAGIRLGRFTPGPAARHALWLIVLIKLVTPPLIRLPWPTAIPGLASLATEPATAAEPAPARPAAAKVIAAAYVPSPEPAPAAGPLVTLSPSRGGWSPTPTVAEVAAEPAVSEVEHPDPRPRAAWSWRALARPLRRGAVFAWLAGSLVLGGLQAARIRRFRRHLRDARPAPAWLVAEAGRIGRRLAVRVPKILAVPRGGSPLLWCLGRPLLVVPCDLVETLDPARWRGILAHELAHLRRGDHWVRRLELAAGLVWWWNPLCRLACRRLDDQAELACDAWVVWALPDDRFTYAESLVQICAALSPAKAPAPSLGVAGAGRVFERRLTMILRDRVACRLSAPGVLAAALLAALALPSWSAATPLRPQADEPRSPVVSEPEAAVAAEPAEAVAIVETDDDDEDAEKAERAERREKKKKADGESKEEKEKSEKESKDDDVDLDIDLSGLEDVLEKAFGPDFEKKMEAFGEKIAKEMEEKFGPGSDFEAKMKELCEDLGKKFGPGSEFEAKIKGMSEELAKKLGPDSELAQRLREKAEARAKENEKKAESNGEQKPKSKFKADSNGEEKVKSKKKADSDGEQKSKSKKKASKRSQRIKELEKRIEQLAEELKKLEDEDDDDEEGGE